MMAYKNPIPEIDAEDESKVYFIRFAFPEPVTPTEALRGVNELLIENGGKINADWLKIGFPNKVRVTKWEV